MILSLTEGAEFEEFFNLNFSALSEFSARDKKNLHSARLYSDRLESRFLI